jgi:hypothetical protein
MEAMKMGKEKLMEVIKRSKELTKAMMSEEELIGAMKIRRS